MERVMGKRIGWAAPIAVAAMTLAGAPAGGTVPPKNCGYMSVAGHRYNIKADQIRCATARPYATSYLRSHSAPRGYTCRDYSSGTKLKFRCTHGIKVFFAIKR